LAPTPLPAITAQTDASVAFMKDDAALFSANADKALGRACIADVKQAYAEKKGKK